MAAKVRPAKDPRVEEREARERQRKAERLQRAAGEKRRREQRQTRAEVIRDELAKPAGRRCRCGITPRTTLAQLREMGAGCTAGMWVCPCLDAIRRRLS